VAANRRAHRRMPRMVAPSGFVRALLVRNGFPAEGIDVIPYFTDLPGGPDAEPEARRVLFVGRLAPEKGIDLLMDALASLSAPCALDVVGDGPEMDPLRRKAEAAKGRVDARFHGWVDNAEVSRFYRRAALLAFPSYSLETFGIVGIEAMAHRRPVVAFDVGGVREWLAEGETGYAVPRKDVAALAGRIGRLLEDRELARRLGERGRALVEERFTREAHMRRLVPLLESARVPPSTIGA
ncbi:MAG: glycosyltransferase family 4 protein, partial [Nitrospinota bacterium]